MIILLLLGACNEDEEFTLPCDENVICTKNLVWLSVNISDKDGNPITLTKYHSIDLKNHKKYDFQDPESDQYRRNLGRYPVLSDIQYKDVSSIGNPVKFEGYINNKLVFSQLFIIGKNCCHIYLLEGDLDQTIDI